MWWYTWYFIHHIIIIIINEVEQRRLMKWNGIFGLGSTEMGPLTVDMPKRR